MQLSEAARIRRDKSGRYVTVASSRGACWVCGLREQASIHGSDAFWQHEYVPAILTKAR